VLITLSVFAGMIGVWCAAAAWLGAHLAAVAAIRRFSHVLAPVVFIAIGVLILARFAIPSARPRKPSVRRRGSTRSANHVHTGITGIVPEPESNVRRRVDTGR
jgi:hypothetical protein